MVTLKPMDQLTLSEQCLDSLGLLSPSLEGHLWLGHLPPRWKGETSDQVAMTTTATEGWLDQSDKVHTGSAMHAGLSDRLAQWARLAHDTVAGAHMLLDILDEWDRIPTDYFAVPKCHCFFYLDRYWYTRHIPTQGFTGDVKPD